MVVTDFVMESNDEKNLTVPKCKAWWENIQKKDYFKKETKTDADFHLSKPDLIAGLNLTKSSFILEFGCGFGRETRKFCEISDNVYGLDISQEAADLTKTNAPKSITASFDGINVPHKDNMFDLTYSCFVIQHMSKPSALALMKESKRVLKVGGHMLFEFFSGSDYCAGKGKELYSGGLEGMYNNGWEMEEIKQAVQDIGMETVFINENKIVKGVSNIWLCCKKVN